MFRFLQLCVLATVSVCLLISPAFSANQTDTHQVSTSSAPHVLVKTDKHGGTPNARLSLPRYVPDEVLFSIKDKAAKAGTLDKLVKKYSLDAAAPVATGRKHWKSSRVTYKARLKSEVSPIEVSRELKKDPIIEWAEPNYYRYIESTQPNDPSRNMQSYLWIVDAYNAWDTITGSSNVVIAVIDTGVQWDHPDLSLNIWTNTSEVADDSVDNDNNGFIDDIRGWDFVSAPASAVASGEDPEPRDNDPMDVHSHGTHVAGIAGAAGNNGIGVTGINWNVSVMPVRAGYKDSSGYGLLETADIADALIYAADNGAHIINMSFGGPDFSQTERAALDYCSTAGCLLIAAAGNDSTDAPSYPAAFDNVTAVASTNNWRKRSYFSNYGLWVDITAPGESIYNTIPGGTYSYKSGTSMAAPIAAGAAALIKAAHPEWTADDIRLKLLSSTAEDLYSINPLFLGFLGAGSIQIDSAVSTPYPSARMETVSTWIEETSDDHDGAFDPNETLKMLVSVRNFGTTQSDVSLIASTTDPYTTISDNVSVIGYLDRDRTKTNTEDPIVLTISPDAPKDHQAAINIRIHANGTAQGSPDTLSVRLNPILRDRLQLSADSSQTSFTDPVIVSRPGGGAVVLYRAGGQEAHIYSRMIDTTGIWTPAVRISESTSTLGGTGQCLSAAADGSIHAGFIGFMGGTVSEISYNKMDPASGTWSVPVQLTTGAVLRDSSYFYSPCAIATDPAGNPHLVWVDHRNGGPEVYYCYYDGSTWSNPASIASPTSGPKSIYLGFSTTGTGYLVWNQPDSSSSSIKMMKLTGGTWGAIEHAAGNAESTHMSCAIDSQDRLHVVFTGPTGTGVSYIQFNDGQWSQPFVIFDDTNVLGTGLQPEIAVAPGDILHVVRQAAPGWDSGDYSIQIFESVYRDGSWSTPAAITFGRPECGINSADIAMDSRGTRFLAGDTNDYPYDVVVESSEILPSRLPIRPAVTDNGNETSNPYTLQASWSSSHSSGIAEYVYAVGSAPGEADLVYWKSSGTETSLNIDLSGTPLQNGQTYYVNVRAKNNLGFWSPVGTSDGVTYNHVPSITNVSDVKTAANDRIAEITGAVVTAAFPNFFYIEADDRSCGLRINRAGHTLSTGMRVNVTGVIGTTTSGERCIDASIAVQNGTGTVNPLGISIRQLGGGPLAFDPTNGQGQEGTEGANGLNNIGILVKTWGKVNSSIIGFWSLDTDASWNIEGQWAYGMPAGQGGQYGLKDPTSGYTGPNVYGVNLNGDYNTAAGGPYYLTTGAINCTGKESIWLKFRRWLNSDYQPYVEAKVQVSDDGISWNTVWENGDSRDITDSAWSLCSYDISPFAANKPAVYIRWGYKVGNGALAYSGWNIDDVEIYSETNFCWIDDGSGSPVKVLLPSGVTAPPSNSWVSVTGISSCERKENGKLGSVIRVRTADDIRTY